MKLRIDIKHMKAECCVPKTNRCDIYVIGQGHFIKKNNIESCPGHILYTVPCIILIPCLQLWLGMLVCRVPLLDHCDLLFMIYRTSKKIL